MKVRKPNVKGIMMAKRAQVNIECFRSNLDSQIVSQTPPPAKPEGKKYSEGDSAEEVARLLEMRQT